MKRRLRAAALVLALALCLACSLRSWLQARAEGSNEAPGRIARFANVMSAIPETGVIGYFSNRGEVTLIPTPPFSIRYAFAPRMLVWFPDASVTEWVIGDFTGKRDYTSAGERLGVHLVRDFGDGVVLYKR